MWKITSTVEFEYDSGESETKTFSAYCKEPGAGCISLQEMIDCFEEANHCTAVDVQTRFKKHERASV